MHHILPDLCERSSATKWMPGRRSNSGAPKKGKHLHFRGKKLYTNPPAARLDRPAMDLQGLQLFSTEICQRPKDAAQEGAAHLELGKLK